MEKGYLSVKQLESMKKAELQDLAEKLGVSNAGTVKELAVRIATVEVDVPEESELTEEEKAAGQQAAKEDEAEPTEPTKQPEKPPEAEKKDTAGKDVKAITRYLDKQLNQIKEAGEVFTVSEERAEELVAAAVAKIVK